MSQITNLITTVYRSRGGQAIQENGLIARSISGVGTAAMQAGRGSGILNSQLRAIGTTLRYAFAGTLIFGVRSMLQNLTETQRTLALIGAAGEFERFDNLATSVNEADKALGNLYDRAQQEAPRALTPVLEFNQGLLNLYSTVQGLSGKNAVQMTGEIAKGAQLAMVTTEDLTKSVAGMMQAFGMAHTVQNYQAFIRGFTELIFKAPGGPAAGAQVIQQLPQLAAVARFSRISPAQTFGLALDVLRTGATPAQGLRGLQYLLQSVAVPASEESRRALAQAGITPTTVQQRGGVWALQRLITHARGLGLSPGAEQRLGKLSDDQLESLDQAPSATVAATLGVSGPALDFLSHAIGRIHGIRSLVTIMAQQQGPRGNQLAIDLNLMQKAMDDTAEAQAEFRKRWQDFARRQPLRAAAIGVDALRSEINEALAPLLAPPARIIGRLGVGAVGHEKATHRAVYGVGGGLALLGILRMMGGPGVAGRALGIAGRSAGIAQAVSALDAQGLGGSPANPMYVTVVNQLFGGRMRGGPGGPIVTPGGIAGETGEVGKLGRWARFRRGVNTRVGGWGAAALLAAPEAFLLGKDVIGPAIIRHTQGIPGFSPHPIPHSATEIFHRPSDRQIVANSLRVSNLLKAQSMFNAERVFRTHQVSMHGQAMVELDILARDQTGRLQRKRVHIPMDLWTDGRVPGSKGNPGKSMPRSGQGGR